MQPELRKRVYKSVLTEPRGDEYVVLLDGRPVRTPSKSVLSLPNVELASELAQEWDSQVDVIDPATMTMTKIANTAIDGVTNKEDEVRAELVKFASNDLLCYRADHPQELVERQKLVWDPLLTWVATTYGAEFRQTAGIMPVTQAEDTLDAFDKALAIENALGLAALHVLVTLSGSAVLALAVRHGHLSPHDGWTAAHVDEDWQIAQWGEDAEAQERRDKRWAEFRTAARFLELIG
ncbi:MAG: ATPase [Hyphomicrobiaceae bacterium TMED74]|nr:ATPase [Filomicrobium sp.]RPG35300.1 MAG: ATPase [Hyphomicrobiaceae bacterium TMED74]